MNNTFNITRFGLTFRKDIIENRKQYLFLFLTLLGLIVFAGTSQTWDYYGNEKNWEEYARLNKNLLTFQSIIFCIAGITFASSFSTPMNSKLKRISYLSNPSSTLEKFLTRWIITTIGFVIAFFVALWIADFLRVTICSVRYPDVDIHFLDLSKLFPKEGGGVYSGEYMTPKFAFIFFVSLYLFFQSVFLLGSTFWEKSSFILTFAVCFVTSAIIFTIFRWIIRLFYGGLEGFSNVMNSFEPSNLSEVQTMTVSAVFLGVFTLTFWVLAYFRMKESEIIKRL
jgi:hypothetical protein